MEALNGFKHEHYNIRAKLETVVQVIQVFPFLSIFKRYPFGDELGTPLFLRKLKSKKEPEILNSKLLMIREKKYQCS